MNKSDYARYLQSAHWNTRRNSRLQLAGHRCEFRPIVDEDYKHVWYGDRCPVTTELQVHHLHYRSLGAEQDGDLEVLCRFHHLVREAIGDLDCPTCGDGPMQYDEEDIIDTIREALAEGVDIADLEAIRGRCTWVIHCSYCER